MEETESSPISNSDNPNSSSASSLKMYFGVAIVVLVIVASVGGYMFGKNSNKSDQVATSGTNVLGSSAQVSTAPTPTISPLIPVQADVYSVAPNNKVCPKYGFAQKWEYLTTYTIKENDSLPSIAKSQLGDETRVNEILQINGVGPLVVGATLYLPPTSVPKSSGNLKQVYGKLIDKNPTSWNLALSTDPKGQVILVPTYLFEKVSNKDSFNVGDCLKVFLDDGYQIYTVSLQSEKSTLIK